MGAAIKIRNLKYLIIFLLTTTFFFIQSSYATTIDKIIAFGDSLTDNGNLYALTKKANQTSPLIPIIPNEPYYNGRFSNGPVWVEEVAKNLNVPLIDYAYGGSWAESFRDSYQVIPFDLNSQVNFYLLSTAPDFDIDKHLFVIWAGANDYSQGRTDMEYATTNTVASIKNQIDLLLFDGARNIVIFNIPDLSITPAVAARGPDVGAMISTISQLHNSKMAAMVEKEKQENPDVKIIMVDVTKIYRDILDHPDKYLLKNVKDACYGGNYFLQANMSGRDMQAITNSHINILKNTSLKTAYLTSQAASRGAKPCANPDEYLFWDHMHPTQVAHKILATLLTSVLAENDISGKIN